VESRTGSREAVAGYLAAGRGTPDGHGLESGGADLFLLLAKHESELRRDGAEVHRGLGHREELQVGAQCCGCGQLWRADARIPSAAGSQQVGGLRAQPGAGGAATNEQQCECRRKLYRGRPPANQRAGSGPGSQCARYRKHGHSNQDGDAPADQGYCGGAWRRWSSN